MEDRPAKEGVKMKEQSPRSLKEKAARAVGVGLIVGAGALPDTRPIQASEVQKHIDSPDKIEQFEKQGMPSANALLEAGFQIGGPSLRQGYGGQANPEVPIQVHTGGVLIESKQDSGAKVEASQTITETFTGIKLDQPSKRDIRGQFVEKNAQDNSISIWAIARTDSDMSSALF